MPAVEPALHDRRPARVVGLRRPQPLDELARDRLVGGAALPADGGQLVAVERDRELQRARLADGLLRARAIRLPDSRARASVGRMSGALMRTGTPERTAAPGAAKEMVSGSLMA